MIRKLTLLAALLAVSPLHAADSYNELLGIGSHSEDANLEGWWLLNENAASTAVADQSSNARNGTHSTNTDNRDTTGPNSYLTAALDWTTAGDKITVGSFSALNSLTDYSILAWVRADSNGTGAGNTAGRVWEVGSNDGIGYTFAGNLVFYPDGANITGGTVVGSGWTPVAFIKSSTDGAAWVGASETSAANTATLSYTGDLVIGNRAASDRTFDGAIASLAALSRTITDAEYGQFRAGPELNYGSGATLSDAGAYNVGTWALPSPFSAGSNGTATYIVSVVNTAGSVVGSDTTATGTIDVSSEAGNLVYLMVRASNTGGYDIGDKATRSTSFGSAGDGYYEIASVTVAGGSGSAVPVLMHHYRGLR